MSDSQRDRIVGSVLGLAVGDALGAPYEGGVLERSVWRLIGRRGGKRRWTDDTQTTLDTMESLAACGGVDQNDLARRLAQSYRWSRGYGHGAACVLKRIRRGEPWESASRVVFRDGSFGNGAAMRSPAVGLFFASAPEQVLIDAAQACALVTHAHSLGRQGAVLIAAATALASQDATSTEVIERLSRMATSSEFANRLKIAGHWLQSNRPAPPRQIAGELGNGIAAAESCITAVYLALMYRDKAFDELLATAIRLGGDVDTITAMACAVWGAARGLTALPTSRLESVEASEYLTPRVQRFADAVIHHRSSHADVENLR